jgi:TonB family protein
MTHRSTHVLAFAFYMVAASTALVAQVASSAYENTAVDIKGVRHTAREYRDHRPPWNFADRIKAIGPTYPFADRQRYHQGSGLFRITIDSKTGAAAHVTVLRSTGYASLDNSAMVALARWRWKPGTWKQVDMPITFEMVSKPPTTLPPGATRLPPR